MLVIVVPCGCFVFQNVLRGRFVCQNGLRTFFLMLRNATIHACLCSSQNYTRKIGGGLFILLRPPPPRRLDFRLDDGWTDGQTQPCKYLNDWWILRELLGGLFRRCKIISFVRYVFLVFFSQQLLLGFFFKSKFFFFFLSGIGRTSFLEM
jgi:hypothetical protein